MVEVSPHLSLAFALHSNPGTYALLLGAGVSLPAGVPSAWQVLHSLIGELAAASGQEWPADPEAWWTQTYGTPPTYDGVLEALTNSVEERRTLLAQFFEPTAEERDEGKKQPTAAHHAIARLVQHGAVRLILTTNFDLLTETALRQVGIEPVVVSTPDAISGMAPLHAQQCAVIHLHGGWMVRRVGCGAAVSA
jgi:NAD-dependent SIR2 family protein deacetylase